MTTETRRDAILRAINPNTADGILVVDDDASANTLADKIEAAVREWERTQAPSQVIDRVVALRVGSEERT